MTEELEPGLRERKRRATRLAIQRAAVQLVLEQGSGVTVEEISHRAEVSPRTFFNYFPTKEDALLGSVPPLPAGEARERFVTAGPDADLIDGLATMLATMTDDVPADSEVYHLRRELTGRYPELAARRLLSTRTLEQELLAIVEERLTADASAPVDPDAIRARARLVTFAAFGVIRSAWMRWVDLDGATPMSECIHSAFSDARALFGQK
jgi:AcrR family transcriptional regulator